MTTLFLHIGTEKTGTTSIQQFFRANREALAGRGVLYPVAAGQQNHTALAVAAQDDFAESPLKLLHGIQSSGDLRQFRRQLGHSLGEELKGRNYPVAILSNEHCSSRLASTAEVQRMQDLLSAHFERIFILVYIRRQDELLLSAYSTAVKSGSARALAVPGPAAAAGYDYASLLSRWSDVFGREQIICRRFEKSSLRNGDVVDDLLNVVGVPADAGLARPSPANESLDAVSLEFLRLFNRSIPRFSEQNERHQIRDNIIRLLRELSQGALPTLPARELGCFMSRFRESNRQVALDYFGGERLDGDDALFAPSSDTRNRCEGPWLTAERAVEISAYLWENKQIEVNRLTELLGRRDRKARRTARRTTDPG